MPNNEHSLPKAASNIVVKRNGQKYFYKSSRELIVSKSFKVTRKFNQKVNHFKEYKYSGTQHYGTCFCGNDYGKHGQNDEAYCNYPCLAAPDKICGGSGRNSIYRTSGNKLK